MHSVFFITFLLVILVTRFFLYLNPKSSPTFGKFRVHHYMYGLVGIALGVLVHSVIIYATGLALFVDELTYLLMRGKTHEDNYSKLSLFGTLCFVVIVFLTQSYLLKLL